MSQGCRPVVLIVRDGWGRNPNPEHDAFNAVKLAKTLRCDALLADHAWTLIKTSGRDVGLPDDTMGNSEVGHQNIGAGRVVDQESVRITKEIETGAFFENGVMVDAVRAAKDANAYVHLSGIASDAGVHGLLTHLYACLELCKREGCERVALHLFTDGRDTGPFTGAEFVRRIVEECARVGVGQVASICGRYYAMDRDHRWERVEQAYSCLTGVHARKLELPWAATPDAAIQRYYETPTGPSQRGDEFITPTMIGDTIDDALATRVKEGDSVVFYNYRGDRPRELIKAFTLADDQWAAVKPSPDTGRHGFNRTKRLGVRFVTMTAYEQGLPVEVAYPKLPRMKDIAGEYISGLGLRQLRCAETEKFPHVTFFFNDYREEPFPGETRSMAQSPKVATYDLQPSMSAPQVRDAVLERLKAGPCGSGDDPCEDFILVNFANGDMVGHTGSLEAAIEAVETVDACVGEIVDATLARGGALVVTADHGNAEQMYDPINKSPHTAHTTYPVECIIVAGGAAGVVAGPLREGGRLADVMPTVLELMGLDQPAAMTGVSLLKK